MFAFKTLAAVTALAFVTACSTPGAPSGVKADEHAGHHPDAQPSASVPAMPGMPERMKAMHEMHDKMMSAKTPAERQALMADHLKAMQDGMAMMKGMGGGKGMPADMSQRHQMMEGRMEMMQMMMEMMVQRLPDPPSVK